MKKILPRKRKDASPNISIDGNLTTDKNLISESFNKCFTSSVTRLLESVQSLPIFTSFFPSLDRHPDFKFVEVSEAYVGSLLRRLKTGKAVGLDNIPAHLLVDSADIVAKPLTEIINTSLQCGVVPLEWKVAHVVPLFKKGKAENMDNYRPISIMPAISKVLERVVHHQLLTHLQSHEILSPYQCGFRKCHSTEWAAMCFADTIRRNIEHGCLTGAVFIVLSSSSIYYSSHNNERASRN